MTLRRITNHVSTNDQSRALVRAMIMVTTDDHDDNDNGGGIRSCAVVAQHYADERELSGSERLMIASIELTLYHGHQHTNERKSIMFCIETMMIKV